MGEQIAYNKALHVNMQLFENESGEYYPVIDPIEQPTLIRGEYIPIGNRLHYPKKWGRKLAAQTLLEHKIKIERDTILSAQKELEKLEACLNKVKEWPDNE
jgi:hypothetical protein